MAWHAVGQTAGNQWTQFRPTLRGDKPLVVKGMGHELAEVDVVEGLLLVVHLDVAGQEAWIHLRVGTGIGVNQGQVIHGDCVGDVNLSGQQSHSPLRGVADDPPDDSI